MQKTLLTLTLGIALAFGSQSAFAQAKKKPAAPAADATKAVDAVKAKADRPIPMYVRADEIDAAGKTFTMVTKEGKKSKHTVTATTEIKNGDAAAKFEDIKVGDYVSGLRKKTAEGEFEVVKISKFAPKAVKAPEVKKPETKAKQ